MLRELQFIYYWGNANINVHAEKYILMLNYIEEVSFECGSVLSSWSVNAVLLRDTDTSNRLPLNTERHRISLALFLHCCCGAISTSKVSDCTKLSKTQDTLYSDNMYIQLRRCSKTAASKTSAKYKSQIILRKFSLLLSIFVLLFYKFLERQHPFILEKNKFKLNF